MYEEATNSLNYWNQMHTHYDRDAIAVDDWLDQYAALIDACDTPILDLGCGSGNDTLYLLRKGKQVYAVDQSENAIRNITKNFPEVAEAKVMNMLDGIDYPDNTFDIVIADLSLHYFDASTTHKILSDIRRILRPGGHLLVRVNSIKDVNHGAGSGEEVEHHLYRTDNGMFKRFFDEADIREIFSDFQIIFLEEQKMLRYKLVKMVYNAGFENSDNL